MNLALLCAQEDDGHTFEVAVQIRKSISGMNI